MIELHTGEQITFAELITELYIARRDDLTETWRQAVEHVVNDFRRTH